MRSARRAAIGLVSIASLCLGACGGNAEPGVVNGGRSPSTQGSGATAGTGGSAGPGLNEGGAASGSAGDTSEPQGAAAGPPTFPGPNGQTCTCEPLAEGYGAQLSLECFVEAYGEYCPASARDIAPQPVPLGPWILTKHTGCGQVIQRFNGGLGGSTCIYDAETNALIGASAFSDSGFPPCNSGGVTAGVPGSCSEGELCSLQAGASVACIPACSIEAFFLQERATRQPFEYEVVVAAQHCGETLPELKPRLRRGCGREVFTQSGGAIEYVFDAETHELLSAKVGDPDGECGGIWGARDLSCDTETTCELCGGDPGFCQL